MKLIRPRRALTPSTLLVTGSVYTIADSGTTTWTTAGAANNNVGTTFTATGTAAGTGTAFLNSRKTATIYG